MKNNRTANQNKNARAAYRALVAARTAGQALAELGSSAASRSLVRSTREDARQELTIAGHYPDEFTADEATTWCAEDLSGEPYVISEYEDTALEELTFNLHNNLGDYIRIDYKASYHKGHEQEARVQFVASHLATDENTNEKLRLYNVAAYKSARYYADRLALQVLKKRAGEEYGRKSFLEDYAPWELDTKVETTAGGYTVIFEYTESGTEIATFEFSHDGRLLEAQDGDGNEISPKEDEREKAREAVVEHLQELIDNFR